MNRADGPIGLFDSGVGGLTVVRAVRRRCSGLPVRYVADQAHVPYGDRPPEEIRQLALEITQALLHSGCSAVIMACNISSATALHDALCAYPGVPILGVIEPAVSVALSVARGTAPSIGVLATQGTVSTGMYPRTLGRLCPAARVTQVACPAFVPLIEQGTFDGPEVRRYCREYLAPIARAECSAVILGCTHYPYLLPALEETAAELCSEPPPFVDPADAVARELLARLQPVEGSQPAAAQMLTTGDPARFAEQLRVLLEWGDVRVGKALWRNGRLMLELSPVETPFAAPRYLRE